MSSELNLRRLSTAVLTAAIYDAAGLIEMRQQRAQRRVLGGGGDSAAEIQREAYAWLTTWSERLELWAEGAGLDAKTVMSGADAAIAYAKRTPRRDGVWGDVRNPAKLGRRGT